MGNTDWDRVKEVFHEVRHESGEELERRLDELCGDDRVLRAEVVALLEGDAGDDSFLDSRVLDAEGEAPLPAPHPTSRMGAQGPGDRIGPYKLLQVIGEGGFGVVYMAEQDEPIRRRVALKVVKPGMDTKQVIARFEAERQALAMMDHPNIAKVFDAGATPTGRPYFAMELVRGVPITDYCDEHTLDTAARLELFGAVCGAVHHAHQHGIIHRDLKPSNVMVTLHDGKPVPKVIDFGVAKATRQRLTETTLFTEYNQFIGTPTYMSPEQATYEGLDVDARSDVYSLGVLLYELLTGTTPHDSRALKRAAYMEVLRILKEEEPPKPSTRVHTMGKASEMHAKHRRADPGTLERLLRGDLDWIVMKALEKDRQRRYGSASDLAADITRYFEQKPILARPPSRVYRARKFARRRRGTLATAAAVALAFFGELAFDAWRGGGAMADVSASATEALLLTDADGCLVSPEPSPDGSKVMFTEWCEQGGVHLLDVATGETERLPVQGYTEAAIWSPDGARLALGRTYVSTSREVTAPRVYDLAAGTFDAPPALADLVPHEWSPDGEHVSGMVTRDRRRHSVVVSLSSGDVTVLAEDVRRAQGQGQALPAFSPDGRFVVFGDRAGETEDLFVTELASGERWPLVTGPEAEGDAIWSPDGETITYQTVSGTWAIDVAEGRPAGQPRLLARERHTARAWTEHGYYYVVENRISRGHRIRVDPATGRPDGTWEQITLPGIDRSFLRAAWSPDMTRLAVGGCCDGLLHLLEGSTTTTIPIGTDVTPAKLWWSADGSEVLFITARGGDRSTETVQVVDVNEGTVRDLFPGFDPDAVAHMHVSPDGRSIVSIQSDEHGPWGRIVLSETGTLDGVVLAERSSYGRFSGVYGQPLFSPDGSKVLYYRSKRGEGTTLWVVGADGTGETLLASAQSMIASPSWDPSGRLVAFETLEDGNRHLRVVSVETGETHDITGLDDFDEAWLLNWSTDGSWITVSESVGQYEFRVNRDILGEAGT